MSNTKSKKPTNQDVARLAGVSVATVSYVINGRTDQKITEETKKKVLHAINILGYVPNPHAVAMKSDSREIVVRTSKFNTLLQNLEALYWVREFTKRCAEKGYSATFSAEEKPTRVAASACVCLGLEDSEFHALANENFIPVIAVDCLLNDPVFYQVTTDYDKIRKSAEKICDNFTYVAVEPNNSRLKNEIASVMPNVKFVNAITDLADIDLTDAVICDGVLTELLKNRSPRAVAYDARAKLDAVIDCVEKAINRESVADELHYIRI